MSATKTRTTFRLEVRVTETIHAAPERVWALLTDAKGFPSWNSTVESIDGEIAEGEKLAIKVKAAPGRVFSPTVSGVKANAAMTWSDGFAPMFRGVRTYTLTPKGDGETEFEMCEVFTGLMLPMIAGSLPDFVPVFDQYAADLKRAAEA